MHFPVHTIEAAIVGGAVGDVLGGIPERCSLTLSDDTQLTLGTCEAIVESGAEPEAIARQMLAWFRAGEITGIGASTLKAMRDLDAGVHWASAGARRERAAGNGAAMRAAPLAFVLDPSNPQDRTRLRDIARITHHHDEAYVGALAVVLAVRRAAIGRDWASQEISPELPDSRVRDYLISGASLGSLSAVVQQLGSSGFVAETVVVAFELARQICTTGFKTAIYALNEMGGDTDTIGAIAGQIAGAALGTVSSELLDGVPGADRVLRVARQFAAFASRGRPIPRGAARNRTRP
jgi:ADP-ribosylglycohydrolase